MSTSWERRNILILGVRAPALARRRLSPANALPENSGRPCKGASGTADQHRDALYLSVPAYRVCFRTARFLDSSTSLHLHERDSAMR